MSWFLQDFVAETVQCGSHIPNIQAEVSFLDQYIQCQHNACTYKASLELMNAKIGEINV